MSSAKVNLNRYWNKFEKLFLNDEANKTALNNTINSQTQPLLNNSQTTLKAPIIEITDGEVYDFLTKSYSINVPENNLVLNGQYKHFTDDAFYNDVDIVAKEIMACPCTCHKKFYKNRYSVCVMEGLLDAFQFQQQHIGTTSPIIGRTSQCSSDW